MWQRPFALIEIIGTILVWDRYVDILQLFKDTATPAGNPDQVGAGVINAAKAFNQIATQTGVITGFSTEFTSGEEGVISLDTLRLTLNGAYFPEATQSTIWRGGTRE